MDRGGLGILQLVDAFLRQRRHPDNEGVFPLTDPTDVKQLTNLIAMTLHEKWSADPYGMLPVEVEVTDVTRFEHLYMQQLPMITTESTEDEIDEYVRRAEGNVQSAINALNRGLDLRTARTKRKKLAI
jgi:hypothetical protein